MVEQIQRYGVKAFGTHKPIRRAIGAIFGLIVVLVTVYVAARWTTVIPQDWGLFLGRKIPQAISQLTMFAMALLVVEWSLPGETIGTITNIDENSEWQRVACATALTIAFIWAIVTLIKVV